MAPLVLRSIRTSPPGGFRYYVAETSTWIPQYGHDPFIVYEDLIAAVRRHFQANSLPIPPQLEIIIQEQLCKRIGDPNWCGSEDPIVERTYTRRNRGVGGFNFQALKQGTATLVDFVFRAGRRRVEDSDVTARGSICATCPENAEPLDCSACNMNSMKVIVERLVGGHSLPIDTKLRNCRICGCNLKAKTRIPSDILLAYMPEDQIEQLPEFCWLKKDHEDANRSGS